MSAAVALYRLLEAADREGFTIPSGTRRITVDGYLCVVIARKTGLEASDVYEAFYGVPVKAARAICLWAAREAPGDLAEQTEMMLRWSSRHSPKATHLREVS